VDLSYRIQKAGYRNFYFAGTTVLHFKGESTRKGSMNYTRMFYKAMSLFVRKHYGGSRAGLFNFLIHIAIWMRATLTAIAQFIQRIGLPLIDAALIFLSFWLMKNIWTQYIRPDIQYENRLLWIAFPAYTGFYLITSYYAGLYDRWYKRSELVRSTLIAIIALLAAYSLLPERYRFSRGIILFGALLAFALMSLLRWVLVQSKVLNSNKEREGNSNTLIVGSSTEYEETVQLMKDAGLNARVLGRVAVEETDRTAIGEWRRLGSISNSVPFREVIYCEGVLSFGSIIENVQMLPGHIRIKFHAKGSSSIVGSDSKDSSGESVSKENGFKMSDPHDRRLKRLADAVIAFIGLITFPIQLVLVKHPLIFFGNCLSVLFGKKTWIGYAIPEKGLPLLKPGVLACNGVPLSDKQNLPTENLHMMDYWYARDYELVQDLKLLWRKYRRLGG
jgi:hypothetical protein